MTLTQTTLIVMKRSLLAAHTRVQECVSAAWRAGDADLAARLRDIAERLTDELDYIDRQISGQA